MAKTKAPKNYLLNHLYLPIVKLDNDIETQIIKKNIKFSQYL